MTFDQNIKILEQKAFNNATFEILELDEMQRMQEIQHSNEANDKIKELMSKGAEIIAEIESSMKAEIQYSWIFSIGSDI